MGPTTPKPAVRIIEVGPRDGLQNIPKTVPTSVKVELIRRLARAGLRTIEATSFVSPRWIPQLADNKDVLRQVMPLARGDAPVSLPVLVPNLRGLDDALAHGVEEVAVFVSASEGFSRNNVNCGVDEALARAREVATKARRHGFAVRGYISCITECPYDGPTSPHSVLRVAQSLLSMGCHEISLGDTLGTATPSDVTALLSVLLGAIPASRLAGHFHDTRGRAVANVLRAYDMGLRAFDSSVAGLGGCPYAGGRARGNVATEDVVAALERRGVSTGCDLGAVVDVGRWIVGVLGVPNRSWEGARGEEVKEGGGGELEAVDGAHEAGSDAAAAAIDAVASVVQQQSGLGVDVRSEHVRVEHIMSVQADRVARTVPARSIKVSA